MSEKLKQTGLYHIAEGSLIYYELCAYAEGLDILYEVLNELENECFIMTAKNYGLSVPEKIVNKVNVMSSRQSRRSSVINALSVTSKDRMMYSLEKYLNIFNIKGEFTENVPQKKITLVCETGLTETQKQQITYQMSQYMPCWMKLVIEN